MVTFIITALCEAVLLPTHCTDMTLRIVTLLCAQYGLPIE